MAGPESSLTLILGGARSGKSTYAEALASTLGRPVLYVATAEVLDEEMAARRAAHRARRPADWRTLEVPTGVAAALASEATARDAGVILLDCLTLLVSNVILSATPESAEVDPEAPWRCVQVEVEALLEAHRRLGAHLLVVSNEVGLGVVPAYGLGRIYRDCLGWANQRLAREAERVVLMLAGLPLDLKALPLAWPD